MKFVLKDGLVHIVDYHGIPNNRVEGIVESPGISYNTIEYSINNGPFKPVNKGKIALEPQHLKGSELSIRVRGTGNGPAEYYKSDTIPLLHTVILGGSLEDRYPEALKFLLKEMKSLKKELKGNMLEVVNTFEEIVNKGSLF